MGQQPKAWYKRWWAIAGALILTLTIIAGLTGGESTETPSQDAARTEQAPPPSTSEAAPSPTPEPTTKAPPPTPEPTTKAPPPPPPEPDLTPGQENALRAAEQYIDFTSFSRTGLIGQLEFEDYSTEDATWAVDQLSVDWNQQAALKAEEYLDFTSFSRQGLVDQLVFEGFTPAQAEYGASQAYDG